MGKLESALMTIPEGYPIPYGIHDVEHTDYGWARTVKMGNGSVAMVNLDTDGSGVALGMFNHTPMPVGIVKHEDAHKLDDVTTVDIMFVFESAAAISAMEHMLANAKIQLRRKSIP